MQTRTRNPSPHVSPEELAEQCRTLAEASQAAMNAEDAYRAEVMYAGLCVLAPRVPLGPLGLAEIHVARGCFDEARKAAKRAIHAPHCDRRTLAYAYRVLAKAYVGAAMPKEAAKALSLTCELDPDGLGADLARAWMSARPKGFELRK